ncbi:MAG: PilT/PilU family type 4a pilus ATPase [Acidobacteriota bacterium]|nr:PilT/PilU family type 4a pilus ATPase [Acidobacteriota bacterium]MDH3522589.1 PilT/PilU family type 4a pilus ATPase [Acidobacteriota bacterium]
MKAPRIDRFLKLTADRGASDLHLAAGRPPMMRIAGDLDAVRYRILDDAEIKALIQPICRQGQWRRLESDGECDFAYEAAGVSRFRVNLFRQHHGLAAVFRVIPTKVVTLEQLGLPASVANVADYRNGLVLMTGPTGAGKSTTLAALLDLVNRTRRANVITIEDPIEFVHENRRCIIHQREVGSHTRSFASAVRVALREDPDVILVGELRDAEVIETALRAADAGLLVMGTLHTNSAGKTLDRMLSAFPADRRDGISQTLAATLRAVVAQQLVRRIGGGRVAALEVLFATPALGAAIREGQTYKIRDIIRAGRAAGMVTMDDSLRDCISAGTVEPLAAFDKAIDKDGMRSWLKRNDYEIPADIETPLAG